MAVRLGPLPVIVISGFVESGKSTVLQHWATSQRTYPASRWAMASQTGNVGLESIELFCSDPRVDGVLLEAQGTTEPVDIVEQLAAVSAGELARRPLVRALWTVIDASRFLSDFQGALDLASRLPATLAEDDRTVSEVLIEQIEFANRIILNKCDLVSAGEGARLAAILESLNPEAAVVPVSFGRLPYETAPGMEQFNLERTAQGAGWLQVLRGRKLPQQANHGLGSFVYRARRPFHPVRLWEFLGEDWPGVLRSQGLIWLATRPDFAGLWAQAGGSCRIEPAGFWMAALAKEDWPDDPSERELIEKNWLPAFGDRRQELAFIGLHMDQGSLQSRLDACLLSDAETQAGENAWVTLEDPFGDWGEEENSDCDHHD
jgi:G3E family GTPase